MIAFRLIALFDEFNERVKGELFETSHLSFESAKPLGWITNCVFQRCKLVVKVKLEKDVEFDVNDFVEQLKLFAKNNRFVDCDIYVLIFDNSETKVGEELQSAVYDVLQTSFDAKVDINNTLSVFLTQ